MPSAWHYARIVVAAGSSLALFGCQPTESLNNVSRYAHYAHLVLYADGITSERVRIDVRDGNGEEAYAIADRMANDMYAAASKLQSDAPEGFDRTGEAFEEYALSASKAFRDTANDLSAPSLERSKRLLDEMARLNARTKTAIDAFESDLDHAPFTKPEKQRLVNRLLKGP